MSFEIEIRKPSHRDSNGAQGIGVRSGHVFFTRLLRNETNETSNYLEARPAQLAFWLVDNWWRLRWEGLPALGANADWRMAHDLSSLGGTAWPRLYMWGDGTRIGLSSFKDPVGVVGPVQFLEQRLQFISSTDWEAGTDAFLKEVGDESCGFGSDRDALRKLIGELAAERDDLDLSAWRRLEARLGYDVDKSPETVMEALFEFASRFDSEGVEEASQATQGSEAAAILEREIEAARASRLQCDFHPAQKIAANTNWLADENIWTPAERAARAVRNSAGYSEGPLRNSALSDILGVSKSALQSTRAAPAENLPYGLRLREANRHVVALRSRRSQSRRFELARALGDVIWTNGSSLGPLAGTTTDRQRFQRNFAQSLLCPISELREFLGTSVIDEEAIEAAAEHYHVNNSLVVRTLQKKHLIPSNSFDHMVEAA